MSENSSSQDKTEQPTPKRKQDAVKKGDIAQSRDLSSFLMVAFVSLSIYLTAGPIRNDLFVLLTQFFNFEQWEHELSNQAVFKVIYMALLSGVKMIAMVLFISFFIAILAGFIMRGKLTFSTESLAFKVDKLDPIKGVKKMFSLNSFVEMIKSVLKFLFILCVALSVLYSFRDRIYVLSTLDSKVSIYAVFNILTYLLFSLLIPLAIIAAIDVPYQIWSYNKKLRMTKQEIKDETKNTDGNPEVKGRVRSIQRSMAQRKMLKDVPEANAIIVNPDHYAVALKYEHDSNAVPLVIAKGVDHMAERIKMIARENNVVVYREPPLARSLYYSTEIGEAIPAGLYLAVAKVLAYLFQVENNIRNEKNQLPHKPTHLDIPEDLLR